MEGMAQGLHNASRIWALRSLLVVDWFCKHLQAIKRVGQKYWWPWRRRRRGGAWSPTPSGMSTLGCDDDICIPFMIRYISVLLFLDMVWFYPTQYFQAMGATTSWGWKTIVCMLYSLFIILNSWGSTWVVWFSLYVLIHICMCAAR